MFSTPILLGLFGTSAALVAVNETQRKSAKHEMSKTLAQTIQQMPAIPQFLGRPYNLVSFSSDRTIGDSGVTVSDEYMGPAILWSSKKVNNQFIHRPYPVRENNLAVFSSTGSLKDVNFQVNDNLVDGNVLWSSAKTLSAIRDATPPKPKPIISDDRIAPHKTWSSDKIVYEITSTANSLQPKAGASAEGNLAMFDETGSTVDASVRFDDHHRPDYSVVWSSKKILESIPSLANVDNTSLGTNLWDSEKINNEISKLASVTQPIGDPSAAGHIPVYDKTGILVDGMIALDDSKAAAPNVLWSSQKIVNTVPVLNDTTVSQNTVWSSANTSANLFGKIDKVLNAENNLASFLADGNVQSSGFKVDDSKSDLTNLWTSTKIEQMTNMNFQKKTVPAAENSLAILDLEGQVVDSGVLVNDNLKADIDVLWSSKKISDSFIPIAQIINKSPDFLLSFDTNKEVTTKFQVNDVADPSPDILWSSDKIMQLKHTYNYSSNFGTATLGNIQASIVSSPYTTLAIRALDTNTNFVSLAKLMQNPFKRSQTPLTTSTYVPLTDGFSMTPGDSIEAFVYDIDAGVVYRILAYAPSTNILNSFISIEQL